MHAKSTAYMHANRTACIFMQHACSMHALFRRVMSIQGTWADALIIQAVADALKVTIQIVKSNQGFAQLTTVYPVQERNT